MVQTASGSGIIQHSAQEGQETPKILQQETPKILLTTQIRTLTKTHNRTHRTTCSKTESKTEQDVQQDREQAQGESSKPPGKRFKASSPKSSHRSAVCRLFCILLLSGNKACFMVILFTVF